MGADKGEIIQRSQTIGIKKALSRMAELVAKYPVLEGLNFEQGLTGELIFVWHGNADGSTDTGYNEKLMVGNHLSRSPNVNVKMYGDIPENAGGTIEYGGRARVFTDVQSKGNKTYYPDGGVGETYNATMGVGYSGSVRKVTLLKTNLTWESTYTPISDNVLYDRYNYMVYKVTTTNTSTGTAEIDALEYFMRVHNTETNNNTGLTKQDHMQWIWDAATQKPVLNPLYPNPLITGLAGQSELPLEGGDTHNLEYVGVPNKGGVLIYNPSDWLEKDYQDLDKTLFSNLDKIMKRAADRPRILKSETVDNKTRTWIEYDTSNDSTDIEGVFDDDGNVVVNTKSIPYRQNDQAGYVNFTVIDSEGGLLRPQKGVGDTDHHGQYSFIVAVPCTTNLPETDGAKGRGYYVDMSPKTTIYFGKLGTGAEAQTKDYSWSDTATKFSYPFGIPEATMTGEKLAMDQWSGSPSNPAPRAPGRAVHGVQLPGLSGVLRDQQLHLEGQHAAVRRARERPGGGRHRGQALRPGHQRHAAELLPPVQPGVRDRQRQQHRRGQLHRQHGPVGALLRHRPVALQGQVRRRRHGPEAELGGAVPGGHPRRQGRRQPR